MTHHREGGRRTEDGVRRYSQGHGSQWVESDDDDEPALYCTDDFRMRCMKVLRCSKKYCHDWTRCPFAHPGEKATRRDPMLGVYTGIACPDMRRDQRCPRGHYCPYAHNVFEYWLHPTRYRTALCRDVERCSRKICFFAHEVHEIRTNVERPYVSPQQLVAATEAASLDPRVQAEFQAAKESSSSKPGLMTGMFSTLDGPTEGEGYDSTTLTLSAPWASPENQEVSNALSSLMRGAAGPLPKPYGLQGAVSGSRLSGNFKSLPPPVAEPSHASSLLKEGQGAEFKVRRSLSDPASRSGNSQASDEQLKSQPTGHMESLTPADGAGDSRSSSGGKAGALWQKEEPQALGNQPSMQTAPAGTREDKAHKMYPHHLNTMVQMPSNQSWGGQQNLMNAAAHLMDTKELGGGLWSTPRGPLENPLYSTSSSISERQSSLEGPLANRLDAVYKQKFRKRQAKRQQGREMPTRFAYPQPYAPQPPIFSSNPNLYSQYPTSTPKDPYSNLPTIPNFWSESPGGESAAQAYQQQQQQHRHAQAAQAQTYLQSMQEIQMQQHQQQQVQAMEALEAQFQLQQAIENELRKLNSGQGEGGHAMAPTQQRKQESLRASLETSFDLRSSQLNDYQGLFSNPRDSAPVAHPASLQSQFSSMYPNAPRLQSNQSLGGFSADPSLGGQLSGVDTQGLRGKDSLYGFAEGGLPDRGEQEGYYKPPASHQVATPNLEDIFSRMNIERSPSAQGPASSVGQRRARE